MLKAMMISAIAASMWAMTPVSAQAGGVDVDLNIGVPGFYRYDDGYYDRRYYRDRWDRPRYSGRLSCNQARRIVRNQGYRNVSARDCTGRTYSFTATRRGDRVRIYVNPRTGALWRG